MGALAPGMLSLADRRFAAYLLFEPAAASGAELLLVIDGAKALASGVCRGFGEQIVIGRCTVHQRRDVTGYLRKEIAGRIDRRLAHAFAHADPTVGLARARPSLGLGRDHPDAPASAGATDE